MSKTKKNKKQRYLSKERKLFCLNEKRLEEVSQITFTVSLLSSSDHEADKRQKILRKDR